MFALGLLEGQDTRTILVGAAIGIAILGLIARQRVRVRSQRRLQAAIEAYHENEMSRYLV